MRREALLGMVMAAVLISGIVAVGSMTPAAREAAAPPPRPSASPTPAASPRPTAEPLVRPRPSAVTQRPQRAEPRPEPSRTHSRSYAWPSPTTTYAPLAATYSLTPGSGTTQTAFTLRVHMTDGDGQAHVTEVDWGDGSVFRPNPGPAYWMCPMWGTPTADPGPYRPSPSDATVSYGHAWRHPGSFQVTVKVASEGNRCGPSPAPEPESTEGEIATSIALDQLTPNGPAAPTIGRFALNPDSNDRRHVWLGWLGYDTDGWLSAITVDWGDGTSSDSGPVDMSGCDDGKGSYYPGTQADPNDGGFQMEHSYARRGSYVVTVTLDSAGCDGTDVQESVRQERHAVG